MIKVIYVDHMGDCLKPCRMARASYNRDTSLNDDGSIKESDVRLLKMLARGMGQDEYDSLIDEVFLATAADDVGAVESLLWKFRHNPAHTAPFGHNFLTVHFEAPVFVMRQIVKHEYIRLSEMSMRYVRGMPEYYKPDSWRRFSKDIKQGSEDDVEDWLQDELYAFLETAHHEDSNNYSMMLDDGLCPEQARAFLRLSHMTQGYITASMDSWANVVRQRLDTHAQYETQIFARQVDSICNEVWPVSWVALTEGFER